MPNDAAPPLLEVSGLCVSYGQVAAVHDVALRVARGSIVTLIGSNGAGKTSTLGALMGLLASNGAIAFDGAPIAALDVARRVARRMVLVPERRELFEDMTIERNLLLGAYQRHRMGERDFEASFDEAYQLFPRLKERRRQIAGTLSGGERQMLAIGRALMAKPRLLMLDEPSLGLAPRIVEEIIGVVSNLRETGVSVLLIEQNAAAALRVADYAYVMESGRIVLEGRADDLANDPRVVATYLGLGARHVDDAE